MSAPPVRPKSEGKTLVVDELSVGFGGVIALDQVSMSATQGEIVGVIGPNGAGKTTLFNVICGFVRARSGVITYDGSSLLGHHHPHDLAKLGIARTLQGVGLCAGLTVLENVMVGAQSGLHSDIGSAFLGLWRSSREERRVAMRARELLDELGVAAYANRLPSTLPYSIQKRTALARALMAEPSLLLLDEPASGLSNDEMDELATMIRGLSPRMGVLLVEHHMDLVMSVCDRLVVLNFGQVIADGTPESVRSNPEVATAYLGDEVHESSARLRSARQCLRSRTCRSPTERCNALSSVTLSARPGAITAILGANGAGKTTLLRTISGLVKPRAGVGPLRRARSCSGSAVENIARRGVAHVPEGRGIIAELTVEENLRLATLWCMGRRERQAAIEATFELFPRLSGFRRRHASTLSGGERQMLVIGRALISRPQAAPARRAVAGLGATRHRTAHGTSSGPHRRDGHDRGAGGAERAQRAVGLPACGGAQPR